VVRTLPFGLPGRFYRGNLHMHSTHSDGALDAAAAIAAYRDHGYDFVSLTEHYMERFGYPLIDTRAHRTDSFTTLIRAARHIADQMLVAGRRLTAVATDDSHFKVADYRGGWVQVRAESREPDALLAALKAGHFYSSSGPELRDVRVEGGRIRVACSPVRAIV